MKRLPLLALAALIGLVASVRAAHAEDMVEFHSDTYESNLDTGLTTATGHVRMQVSEQVLEGDKVVMDRKSGNIRAEGNVIYTRGEVRVTATQADVDMKTGFGHFRNAVVKMGQSFHVEGHDLEYYAKDRYRATNAKLTTCQDCPQAWSVTGSLIDLEYEGYAEVHHALFQIKDNPVGYLPFLYLPIKTKRQSGVLIPQYSYERDMGNKVGIPYFWAISNSSDATFRYDYLSRGGERGWFEFRRQATDRSFIRGQGSLLKSSRKERYVDLPALRYGYSIDQRWQLSPGWTQRFNGELSSDGLYSQNFDKEFSSARLPTLRNEPSLTWQSGNLVGWAAAHFHKDNLPRDLKTASARSPGDTAAIMGQGPINNAPEIGFSLPSYPLFGRLLTTADLRFISFRRRGGPVDPDTLWIRTGDRGTMRLRASLPTPLFRVLDWEPSIEAQGDAYMFQQSQVAGFNYDSTAFRGRLLFDQRLSSDLFRVYKIDGSDLKAVRHSIAPVLRWSYSPPDAITRHPFFLQPKAPRFDLFDPNFDVATNDFNTFTEEQRLGYHHLVTFGLETRVVGRYGESDKSYVEFLSASVNRDFNVLTNEWGNIRIAAAGAYAGWRLATQLSIDTRTGNTDAANDVAYANAFFAAGVSQRVGPKDELYGVSGELRFLRPWYLTAALTYEDKITHRVQDQRYTLGYDGGSSRCFYFRLDASKLAGDSEFRFNPQIGFVVTDDTRHSFF